MKYYKIITAVFVAAIMLTACEKDKVNPTNKSAITDSKTTKTFKSNDKSNNIEQDLTDFITDIQDEVDPASDYSIRGLLFVEAALNFNVTAFDIDPDYQKLYVKDIDINGYKKGYVVSGTGLALLYHDIYNKIDAIADTAQLLGNGSIYVTGIDISFDTANLSGGAAVVFSLGRSSSTGNCNVDGDYSIQDRNIGPCTDHNNPGTRTGENAVDQVSRLVGSRCNQNVKNCPSHPLFAPTWYNVSTIPDPTSSTYTTTYNYYLTHVYNDCVKEQSIDSAITAFKTWQSGTYPIGVVPGNHGYLPNIDITIKNSFANFETWTSGTPLAPIQNYAIKGITMAGQCVPTGLVVVLGKPSW